MDTQRFAAILFIASFVVMMLSMPFGVPGYYQTQDITERVQLVEQYRMRWNINKSLLYFWTLLSAVGVGVLTIYLRRNGASRIALLSALSVALGSVAYFLVNYTQQTDLVRYLAGELPDYHVFGNWLFLAGLLLLGLAFLQAGLPAWLSYLTIGAAIVSAPVLLIWPALFWLIPLFPGVPLSLVIGIVLLRQ